MKHQLLILNRSRQRALELRPSDRIVAGLLAAATSPARLARAAIVLKPSTIMGFHRALVRRKYRLLFTPKRRGKPGPKGPSPELIAAICEMKGTNPNFGDQRNRATVVPRARCRDRLDVVRRVLASHSRPVPRARGPSWLTFLGHTKDSLWSLDIFRCESLTLKSHWVMVVIEQCTRRIVGFALQAGLPDGPAVCRMLGSIVTRAGTVPNSLSSDHDPLFEFHRWKANLRVLEIEEIKTVPNVPLSHPFVERLIGTIRREFLDHVPFWTSTDLERKLQELKTYYNRARSYQSLDGKTPVPPEHAKEATDSIKWTSHCHGLYELPSAA